MVDPNSNFEKRYNRPQVYRGHLVLQEQLIFPIIPMEA